MDTNLLLFYLYILVILLFLCILSYFISKELFYVLYFILFNYQNDNLSDIDEIVFSRFVDFYVRRKQWFLCISMLEFFYFQNTFNLSIISSRLAYCYQQLSYLSTSEFYYLNALSYAPSNIAILKNLLQLYTQSKSDSKVDEINKRILYLNSSNNAL